MTLSWPRRAVVVPGDFEAEGALIQHERTHLRHNDPEITLLLLLIQDVMLRNLGITYLVRQWRLSIELRADRAATEPLTTSQRKAYALLLLNIQSPNQGSAKTLPCPTAYLNSSGHRNVKMRLTEIMDSKPKERKRRWGTALVFVTIGASGIGLTSTSVLAKYQIINADFDQIKYTKQSFVKPPTSCFGLMKNNAKIEEKELMINGRLTVQKIINVGTVVLSHDVRRNGSIYNSDILNSSHHCFEANAKATLLSWKAEPQNYETKNVAVKLHFIVSAETVEELKLKLNGFYK